MKCNIQAMPELRRVPEASIHDDLSNKQRTAAWFAVSGFARQPAFLAPELDEVP
jgi:hypothetical protein